MPQAIGDITLDAKDVLQYQHATLVVRLTRLKQWQVRLSIAKWLMCLAAWIAWFDIEFEESTGTE